MSADKQRSPVYYIEIRQHEKYAFVPDPDLATTRYVKTHRCVYYVPCHSCQAAIGAPCVGSSGKTTAEVHPIRRDLFYKRVTEEAAQEHAKARKKLTRDRAGGSITVRKGGKRAS